VIKPRLKTLGRWLIEKAGGEVKVFVDTAPVMEKPLAEAAGLGWQGKHTNLVSRQLGSWLFLGAIFTTLDLPPDAPERDHCGTCRACLDICPTAAFPAPYRLDARRCISYLTIEHKGPIPRALRPLIGNRIYGCDDCLAVCPWNKFAQAGREAKLAARDALRAPQLGRAGAARRCRVPRAVHKSAVKRIGRDRFLRNVLIAIGNSGDAALAGDAERLLDDPSPLVRGAAVWALGRLDRCAARKPRGSATRRRVRSGCRRGMGSRTRRMRLRCPRFICFGLGYSAEHFIGMFGDGFERIVGTVRGAERAADLNALSCRTAQGAGLRRRRDAGSQKRDRRSRSGARFDSADEDGDPFSLLSAMP
jgi:epoxyqueuosine reductase